MDHQFDESYPFVFIGHVCLARGFELAGERLDLTTVVKEEKVNDRLIQAGEANKNGDTSSLRQ